MCACSGTFTQTGVTITNTMTGIYDALIIGHDSGSSGTYHLNGGTLSVFGVAGGDGTSTFNFNGGTLQARADNGGFVTGLKTAQVRDGGAKIDTNGYNVTFPQTLVHSTVSGDNATDGGLTKLGSGTLTLTGNNTYTGGTFLNGGTLALGSQAAIPSSSNVTFGGGTLQFTGSNSGDYSGRIKNSRPSARPPRCHRGPEPLRHEQPPLGAPGRDPPPRWLPGVFHRSDHPFRALPLSLRPVLDGHVAARRAL